MMRLVRKGPKISEGTETPDGGPGKKRTPARPLSAADDSADADHGDDDIRVTKEI
jgi:cytochrome d ubiquinol oxidase subunit I